MKVLIITRHPIFELLGGAQQYIKTLAKFLEKKDQIEQIFIASSSINLNNRKISKKTTFLKLGNTYQSLNNGIHKALIFTISYLIDSFLTVRRIILKSKNNFIIHSNESAVLAISLLPIKFLYKIPIVITQHGIGWYGYLKLQIERKSPNVIFTPFLFFLEKLFFYFADKIIVVDKTLKKVFYNDFKKKVEVVYNPIDYLIFKPDDSLRKHIRKRLEVKNNEVLLLFMGRLSEEKGIKEVMEAFDQIVKAVKKIKLLIVGTGPLLNLIRIYKNKYRGKVIHIKQTDEPERFYNASDVLIFFSKFEERSRVVPEALGCGVTVLSTPTREILRIKSQYPEFPIFLCKPNVMSIVNELQLIYKKTKLQDKKRQQFKIKEQDANKVTNKVFYIYKRILG
jgi:glycosyltransferase involved in cell wall biosynthesis